MDATGIFLACGFIFVMVTLVVIVVGPTHGWRIAARHEEFIPFKSPHIPRAKIREVFLEQGWKLVRDQPQDMEARTKTSWRSWGELVSLEFRDGGAAVKSQCAFASQVVDYGKNRRNVQILSEALQKKNA